MFNGPKNNVLSSEGKEPFRQANSLINLVQSVGINQLQAVLAQNPDTFTANDFTALIEEGIYKGKNVLMLLAEAASQDRTKPFLQMLKMFPNGFCVADFTAQTQAGSEAGINALWLLAAAEVICKEPSEALLTVLRQVTDTFSATDFTLRVRLGTCPLWFLARAAVEGRTDGLLEVFKMFPSGFSAEYLERMGSGVYSKDIFSLLIEAALANTPEPLSYVLQHFHLNITALKKAHDTLGINSELKNLIQSRIALTTQIAQDAELHTLNLKAAEAQQAGYVEAYYELASHFQDKAMNDDAIEMFLKVPESSVYYQAVCETLPLELIGMATNDLDKEARRIHLVNALKFTLRIEAEQTKIQTLQAIASTYLSHHSEYRDTLLLNPIPESLLSIMMRSSMSYDCFFKELDRLVAAKGIENENIELKEQLKQLESNNDKKSSIEVVTEDFIIKPFIRNFQGAKRVREGDAVSSDDDILQPPTKMQNRK